MTLAPPDCKFGHSNMPTVSIGSECPICTGLPRILTSNELQPFLLYLQGQLLCTRLKRQVVRAKQVQEVDSVVSSARRLPWIGLVKQEPERRSLSMVPVLHYLLNRRGEPDIVQEIESTQFASYGTVGHNAVQLAQFRAGFTYQVERVANFRHWGCFYSVTPKHCLEHNQLFSITVLSAVHG